MDLEVRGSAQSISQEMGRKTFPDFAIRVVGTTWNTLEVQVSPR